MRKRHIAMAVCDCERTYCGLPMPTIKNSSLDENLWEHAKSWEELEADPKWCFVCVRAGKNTMTFSKPPKQEALMTQKKVSPERVAELLGLKKSSPSYLDGKYYLNPIISEWKHINAFDFTDTKWTGMLLEAYAQRLYGGGVSWLGILSALKPKLKGNDKGIATLNAALIVALDTIREEKRKP